MRTIFAASSVVLAVAWLITGLTSPAVESEVPVIYWTTDPNPARIEQIARFHRWLVENGHVTEGGRPGCELRLDTASRGPKQVVQGVSGVAADVMDSDIGWFAELGLLENITEPARAMGFSVGDTWDGLAPQLTYEGRQYGFPCNAGTLGLLVRSEAFTDLGMEVPPETWDISTFERLGTEFVRRANAEGDGAASGVDPGVNGQVYFCGSVGGWAAERWLVTMHRGLGLSNFNETLTRSTLDDRRFAEVLELVRRWTFDLRLMPSPAESASFSSEAGYGGAELSLFTAGRFAMIPTGRYGLIRLREYAEPPALSFSQFPQEGMPNALISARAAGVYAGTRHRKWALLFMQYLASEPYNLHIVESADALPPIPRYAATEAFLDPPGHENEGTVHRRSARAAAEDGIAAISSPFVSGAVVAREKGAAFDRVMSGIATPEEAVRDAAARINARIDLNLTDDPQLKQRYDEAIERQQRIDAARQEGRPVPAEWIDNAFLRRYYEWQGWLESPSGGGVGA